MREVQGTMPVFSESPSSTACFQALPDQDSKAASSCSASKSGVCCVTASTRSNLDETPVKVKARPGVAHWKAAVEGHRFLH